MTIVDVTPDASFTATFTLLLCELRLEYLLMPVGAGRTLVTHRVVFDGMLVPVFGTLFARGVREALPDGLSRLKRIAEERVR
jgi:hypothetical protein